MPSFKQLSPVYMGAKGLINTTYKDNLGFGRSSFAVFFPLCWSKVHSEKNPDHVAEEEEYKQFKFL